MANQPALPSLMPRVAFLLLWIARMVLMAPEIALIAVLLCMYPVFGTPFFIVPLAALLLVTFGARVTALHLARAAIDAARYRDAETLLQIALLLYPWSADGLALRGTLALATGQPHAAEVALRRAIALLPEQPSFRAALSSALLALNRPGEAAAAARDALLLDSRYALAYLYLAEAERVRGASEHVIEEHLRAGLATAQGTMTMAALQCALVGHLLAEHRLAEATLLLHRIEALLPHCSAAQQALLRFHVGELLLVKGQVEHAHRHVHDAETPDPQSQCATVA